MPFESNECNTKDNLFVMCTRKHYIPMVAQYAIQKTEYARALNATMNDSFNQSQMLTGGKRKMHISICGQWISYRLSIT